MARSVSSLARASAGLPGAASRAARREERAAFAATKSILGASRMTARELGRRSMIACSTAKAAKDATPTSRRAAAASRAAFECKAPQIVGQGGFRA